MKLYELRRNFEDIGAVGLLEGMRQGTKSSYHHIYLLHLFVFFSANHALTERCVTLNAILCWLLVTSHPHLIGHSNY